jgi:transcriptional regulator with XRE-family HTH domain
VATKVHALGRAIAAYRAAVDISLNEMSVKVGVGTGPLWSLERGETYPSIQTLKLLAEFFSWTAEDVGRFVLSCDVPRAGPVSARQRRERASRIPADVPQLQVKLLEP